MSRPIEDDINEILGLGKAPAPMPSERMTGQPRQAAPAAPQARSLEDDVADILGGGGETPAPAPTREVNLRPEYQPPVPGFGVLLPSTVPPMLRRQPAPVAAPPPQVPKITLPQPQGVKPPQLDRAPEETPEAYVARLTQQNLAASGRVNKLAEVGRQEESLDNPANQPAFDVFMDWYLAMGGDPSQSLKDQEFLGLSQPTQQAIGDTLRGLSTPTNVGLMAASGGASKVLGATYGAAALTGAGAAFGAQQLWQGSDYEGFKLDRLNKAQVARAAGNAALATQMEQEAEYFNAMKWIAAAGVGLATYGVGKTIEGAMPGGASPIVQKQLPKHNEQLGAANKPPMAPAPGPALPPAVAPVEAPPGVAGVEMPGGGIMRPMPPPPTGEQTVTPVNTPQRTAAESMATGVAASSRGTVEPLELATMIARKFPDVAEKTVTKMVHAAVKATQEDLAEAGALADETIANAPAKKEYEEPAILPANTSAKTLEDDINEILQVRDSKSIKAEDDLKRQADIEADAPRPFNVVDRRSVKPTAEELGRAEPRRLNREERRDLSAVPATIDDTPVYQDKTTSDPFGIAKREASDKATMSDLRNEEVRGKLGLDQKAKYTPEDFAISTRLTSEAAQEYLTKSSKFPMEQRTKSQELYEKFQTQRAAATTVDEMREAYKTLGRAEEHLPGGALRAIDDAYDSARATIKGLDQKKVDELSQIAKSLNVAAGRPAPTHGPLKIDENKSRAIAEFYEKAESTPNAPEVRRAYDALNKETDAQYQALTKAGYKMELVEGEGAVPYANVEDLVADVVNNKRLKVWNGGNPEHGLLTPEQNAKFRFVHDIFGHAMPRASFGHAGEEGAYASHFQMYSPEAQKALATETRGQNAAVHFGKQTNNPKDTIYKEGANDVKNFPPQKATILPEDMRTPSARAVPIADVRSTPRGTKVWINAEGRAALEKARYGNPDDADKITGSTFNPNELRIIQDNLMADGSPAAKELHAAIFKARREQGFMKPLRLNNREQRMKNAQVTERHEAAHVTIGEKNIDVDTVRDSLATNDLYTKATEALDYYPDAQVPHEVFTHVLSAELDATKLTRAENIELAKHLAYEVAKQADGAEKTLALFERAHPMLKEITDAVKEARDRSFVGRPGTTPGRRGGTIIKREGDPQGRTQPPLERRGGSILKRPDGSGESIRENPGGEILRQPQEGRRGGDGLDQRVAPKKTGKPANSLELRDRMVQNKLAKVVAPEVLNSGFMTSRGEGLEIGKADHGEVLESAGVADPYGLDDFAALKQALWTYNLIRVRSTGTGELNLEISGKPTREQINAIAAMRPRDTILVDYANGKHGSFDSVRAAAAEIGRQAGYGEMGFAQRAKPSIDKHLTPDEAIELKKNRDGVYEAFDQLPPDKDVEAFARRGAIARYWYENSANAIKKAFGDDGPKFAKLLAALSPQTTVRQNLRTTLDIWNQWEIAGRPTDPATIARIFDDVGERLEARTQNAMRVLTDSVEDLSGPKVRSFYKNLLNESVAVTNDVWMARFAGVAQEAFGGSGAGGTSPMYLALSAKVRRVAASMASEGWNPQQIQAATWALTKATWELGVKGKDLRSLLNEINPIKAEDVADFARIMVKDPESRSLLNEILKLKGTSVDAIEKDIEPRYGKEDRTSTKISQGTLKQLEKGVAEARAAKGNKKLEAAKERGQNALGFDQRRWGPRDPDLSEAKDSASADEKLRSLLEKQGPSDPNVVRGFITSRGDLLETPKDWSPLYTLNEAGLEIDNEFLHNSLDTLIAAHGLVVVDGVAHKPASHLIFVGRMPSEVQMRVLKNLSMDKTLAILKEGQNDWRIDTSPGEDPTKEIKDNFERTREKLGFDQKKREPSKNTTAEELSAIRAWPQSIDKAKGPVFITEGGTAHSVAEHEATLKALGHVIKSKGVSGDEYDRTLTKALEETGLIRAQIRTGGNNEFVGLQLGKAPTGAQLSKILSLTDMYPDARFSYTLGKNGRVVHTDVGKRGDMLGALNTTYNLRMKPKDLRPDERGSVRIGGGKPTNPLPSDPKYKKIFDKQHEEDHTSLGVALKRGLTALNEGRTEAIRRYVNRWVDVKKVVEDARKRGVSFTPNQDPYISAQLEYGGGSGWAEATLIDSQRIVAEAEGLKVRDQLEAYLNLKGAQRAIQVVTEKANAAWNAGQRSRAIAMRIKLSNGEVAPAGYTSGELSSALAELQRLNPSTWGDIKRLAKEEFKHNRAALDAYHDEGIISDDLYTALTNRGDEYINMSRIVDMIDEEHSQGGTTLTLRKQHGIKELKGSDLVNRNPFVADVEHRALIYRDISRNRAARTLVGFGAADPSGFGTVVRKLGHGQSAKPGEGTVTYHDKGRPVTYAVPDVIADALQLASDNEVRLIGQSLLGLTARMFRAATTGLNLGFAIPNLFRDYADTRAFIGKTYNPADAVGYLGDMAKAINSIVRKDDNYLQFLRSGAAYSTLQKRISGNDFIETDNVFGKTLLDVVASPVTTIAKMNNVVEEMSKVSAYNYMLRQGMDPIEAAARTRTFAGTPDVGNAGNMGPSLNQILMFFTSSIKGIERSFLFGRRFPKKFAALATAAIIRELILNRHNSSFESPEGDGSIEWEHVSDNDKKNYYVVVTPFVQQTSQGAKRLVAVKIPRPHFLGKMLGGPMHAMWEGINKQVDIPQAALDAASNIIPGQINLNKDEPAGSIARGVVSSLNPALQEPIEQSTNTETFGNTPIIPERMKNRTAVYQYDERTSPTAIKLGKLLDSIGVTGPVTSPKRIEHAVRGLTSGAGEMVTSGLDYLQNKDKPKYPFEGTEYLSRLPVIGSIARRFVGSPADQVQIDKERAFYKFLDGAEEATTTLAQMYEQASERTEILRRYRDLPELIALADAAPELGRQAKLFSDIREYIARTAKAKTLGDTMTTDEQAALQASLLKQFGGDKAAAERQLQNQLAQSISDDVKREKIRNAHGHYIQALDSVKIMDDAVARYKTMTLDQKKERIAAILERNRNLNPEPDIIDEDEK